MTPIQSTPTPALPSLRIDRRVASTACVMAICCAVAMGSGCGFMAVGARPSPIRRDSLAESRVPAWSGDVHHARPLAAPSVPVHPHMAPHGASTMHVDPHGTNVYPWAGPVGRSVAIDSLSMGIMGGECPTVNFDRLGRLVTVCVRGRTPSLLLLDPTSLAVLARHDLPQRRTPVIRIRTTVEDTSGGAYFYLDERDRAVVGTAAGTIEIVAIHDGASTEFVVEERIDLHAALLLPDGSEDKLTAVMPDYSGRLWFVGRSGTVGVRDRRYGVHSIRLESEQIENSFSLDVEAAYIVSDHALYRFEVDAEGRPRAMWREAYDRGVRRKVGQINQGSGTTPTILGDYVAIGDNAEPRMNVLVYRRAREVSERRVCAIPVFRDGASATENSLIGHGRSLIVENNAGYDIFLTMRGGRTSSPGITRVDVRADESGCDIVWESQEISQTAVPKLSAATGLVYLYTKRPAPSEADEAGEPSETDAYYFTALDYETGRTVYRVLTGTGVRFDNNWASITLAPDGTAFVGVLNGLLRVRDTAMTYAGSPVEPTRL